MKNALYVENARYSSHSFFCIKIAAGARFACFPTILGTYQIIICTLLTPLERVHLYLLWIDEKERKIINVLCESVLTFPAYIYICGTSIMRKSVYHIEWFTSSITLTGCRWLNLYKIQVNRIIIFLQTENRPGSFFFIRGSTCTAIVFLLFLQIPTPVSPFLRSSRCPFLSPNLIWLTKMWVNTEFG